MLLQNLFTFMKIHLLLLSLIYMYLNKLKLYILHFYTEKVLASRNFEQDLYNKLLLHKQILISV